MATNGTALSTGVGALQLTPSSGNQTGSAWADIPQTVINGFSTSFTFQFTNPSPTPADGIAFVIQNAPTGLAAIGYTGGNGGAIGYGDDDADQHITTGISSSLAIELDSYQNGWDTNNNHVAVQSCGTGYNTSHHGYSCLITNPNSNLNSDSTFGISGVSGSFADGQMHTVTIQYNPPSSPCTPVSTNNLCIYIDQTTTPALSVYVDLSTIGLTSGGAAYVGFAGATGGSFETQDILSWNFISTTIIQTFNTNQPTTSNFTTPGGENQQTLDLSTATSLTCNGQQNNACPAITLITTNNNVSASATWPQYVNGTPRATVVSRHARATAARAICVPCSSMLASEATLPKAKRTITTAPASRLATTMEPSPSMTFGILSIQSPRLQRAQRFL